MLSPAPRLYCRSLQNKALTVWQYTPNFPKHVVNATTYSNWYDVRYVLDNTQGSLVSAYLTCMNYYLSVSSESAITCFESSTRFLFVNPHLRNQDAFTVIFLSFCYLLTKLRTLQPYSPACAIGSRHSRLNPEPQKAAAGNSLSPLQSHLLHLHWPAPVQEGVPSLSFRGGYSLLPCFLTLIL